MSLRLASLLIISLFSVALLAAPALGISVSVSTGDGSGVATSSSSYSLDDSTSLNEEITLMDSELQKSLQASGTGKNEISQQMTGGSSSLQSSTEQPGKPGYLLFGLCLGRLGQSRRGLICAGRPLSIRAGQPGPGRERPGSGRGGWRDLYQPEPLRRTGRTCQPEHGDGGRGGLRGLGRLLGGDGMVATGSFLGQGTLSATLTSSSAGDVDLNGQVSTDGALWLKEEDLQLAAEQSGMITVQGIRATSGGLGSFETKVANFDADALAKARPDQVTTQRWGVPRHPM